MSNKEKKSLGVKRIVSIALMTAILCAVSPFALTIPISPVPISLATFIIYLAIMILGMRDGTISVVLYVLLGFVGAPVFTGFAGGAGKVLGPTGGYIIGYIFMSIITGFFVDRSYKSHSFAWQFLGMVIGTAVLYLFGSAWLSKQANMTFMTALSVGTLPFIIGDLVKIVVSIVIGGKVRSILIKNNFLK